MQGVPGYLRAQPRPSQGACGAQDAFAVADKGEMSRIQKGTNHRCRCLRAGLLLLKGRRDEGRDKEEPWLQGRAANNPSGRDQSPSQLAIGVVADGADEGTQLPQQIEPIIGANHGTFDEILWQTVEAIPKAWLHSSDTIARIIWGH